MKFLVLPCLMDLHRVGGGIQPLPLLRKLFFWSTATSSIIALIMIANSGIMSNTAG